MTEMQVDGDDADGGYGDVAHHQLGLCDDEMQGSSASASKYIAFLCWN